MARHRAKGLHFGAQHMSHDKLRRQIALQAARLLFHSQESDYSRARSRAIRKTVRDGVASRSLPSHREIRDQVQILSRLCDGSRTFTRAADVLQGTLDLMRHLQPFAPRLINPARPVETGTPVLHFEVTATHPTDVERALGHAGLWFEESRGPQLPGPRGTPWRVLQIKDRSLAEVAVFAPDTSQDAPSHAASSKESRLEDVTDRDPDHDERVPRGWSLDDLEQAVHALAEASRLEFEQEREGDGDETDEDGLYDERGGDGDIKSANQEECEALPGDFANAVGCDARTTSQRSPMDRFQFYRTLLVPLRTVFLNKVSHPEGDALYHSLQVFELARQHLPYDEEFLLAALLHDVGKGINPHDDVAAALEALAEMGTERTLWFIAHHHEGQALLDGTIGQRARKRLSQGDDYDELKLLAQCDRQGRVRGAKVPELDEALDYVRALAQMCDGAE